MKERIRYIRHFALLLAAVLMVACSDSQEPEPQMPDILSRFNSEGKAWMSLDINLPVHDDNTRAMNFDEGASNEYAVKTMMIVLFHGDRETTEDNMTVASTYVVDYSNPTDGPAPQVTNHKTVTIQVTDENICNSDHLAVLVIANASPVISSGNTFSTIKALTSGIVNRMDAVDYFVMSNARLAKTNAANAELLTLVNIDANYFFPTEEQSRENPAGHVNVERLAVKTTVENGLSELNHKILGNAYATFTSNDLTFALDNYNATSYLCKHLSSVEYPRMVESTAVDQYYYPYVYRTYWAEDANYSGNIGLTNVSYATYLSYTDAQKSAFWKSTGSSVYCAENTFNVDNMKDNCTTSVLVRLQLNNKGDFYTTSVTGQDIIFQPPSNTLEEQGTSASSSFSRTRSNVVPYDGTNTATIDEYLRTWLMQNNSGFRNWVNTYAAGEVKHVAITLTNNTTTGTATVSSVTQTARTSGSGVSDFTALDLVNYFANNISLKFYVDGFCYYRVPIRHFGDETPWNSTASMTNNSTAQVYGTGDAAANNYLGRYGMVRNNWYNISIQSVTHVGSPIIPALTTDADDKVPQFLNATLNINGWEKHEQNLQ